MALTKAVIPFQYQGMQTKVDSKTAPLGSFEVIENRDMNQFHKLEQRKGQQLLANDFEFDGNLTGAYALNREVGVYTDSTLYTYSTTTDTMVEKGDIFNPIVSSNPVISNTFSQSWQDCCLSEDGKLGVVWVDGEDDGIYFMVKDSVNGAIIVSKTFVASSPTGAPRIVSAKNYFYIFYPVGIPWLSLSGYNLLTGELTLFTSFLAPVYNEANSVYDVKKFYNDNILVITPDLTSAAGGLQALYWNTTTNTLGSAINGLPDRQTLDFPMTVSGHDGDTAIAQSLSICLIDETHVSLNFCAFLEATGLTVGQNYLFTNTYYADFTKVNTSVDGVPVSGIINTSSVNTSLIQLAASYVPTLNRDVDGDSSWTTGSPAIVMFLSLFDGTDFKCENIIAPNPMDTGALTPYLQQGLDGILYHISLVSTAFTVNNRAYAIYTYDSPRISNSLQPTHFILRDDFSTVARLNTKTATGALDTWNALTTVLQSETNTNLFVTCLLRTTRVLKDGKVFYTTESIYSKEILFYDQQSPSVSVENDLYFTGGFLKVYDGYPGVIEHGFHLYPEIVSVAGYNPSLGSFPSGSYSYICVWEWTDNTGQLYRSEPSVAVTYTSTGTTSSWPKLTILALPVTNKSPDYLGEGGRTNVVLSVYRTLKNGTTYYRCNQIQSSWVYNNKFTPTLTYSETVSDTALADNTLLYTTGGVVANTAIPVTNLMCLAKNRLITGRPDTYPLRCYFSKEKEQGLAFEFSEDFYVDVDAFGGNPTAYGAMDDKVVIFKPSSIFFFAGQGPDKLGNGYFTIPQLISADVGCVNPASVVLCDRGLMFKSLKGIYVLTRNLTTEYIGAPVDAYNDLTISSAVNLSDENKVKFTTREGTTLVYDTVWGDWKVYTNQQVVGSVVASSLWYSANSEYNRLTLETTGQHFDFDNRPILGKYRTNWISLANIGGYQRIYSIRIIGSGQSNEHTLNCKLYYDYQDYVSQQVSITPSEASGPTYGSDSPYGSGSPYGSSNTGEYVYEIRPRIQKCTAIKIEIYDEFPEGTPTASFTLSEIVLLAGVKQGLQKISPTRRLT